MEWAVMGGLASHERAESRQPPVLRLLTLLAPEAAANQVV